MAQHVAVIGAGIVGSVCALELVRAGFSVTLIEPQTPGGEQAASYGNAGWISPASIIPMSTPGLWKKIPSLLLDRASPLAIRWQYLPSLFPWLVRFVLSGWTENRVERTAAALNMLLSDAPQRHLAIAAEIGRPDLIVASPLLYVFPDRAAFEAEALVWRIRADNGVVWTELDAAELQVEEPELASRYSFAIRVENGAYCRDPGGYVSAIVSYLEARGVRRIQARATGFDISNRKLKGVLTDGGAIPCDYAIISAGVHSRQLARLAGSCVPLESERGYHLVIPGAENTIRKPVMPSDGKMGITPNEAGLRISGQVELASASAPADWRRSDLLLEHLSRTFKRPIDQQGNIRRWMGHRPSTPDGRPVIDRSRASSQIILAFGHGHIGLASSAATAELVAELVKGTGARQEAFAADRF